MGFISMQDIYDDPKRWLVVLHECHPMLLKMMPELFPDFAEKLKGIHCLQCEGREPFTVYLRDGLQERLCTGYSEYPEMLLRLEDPKGG